MKAHAEVMDIATQLRAEDRSFVLATVMRTVSVTAAKAGAKAVVRSVGSIAAGMDRRRVRAR